MNENNYTPKACPREGCPGTSFDGEKYCCFACRAIALEVENTQRVCEYVGESDLTSELLAEAVALGNACSRYLDLGYQLRMLAMESGITPKQWQGVRKGQATTS
ncbi:hypothetical protein [Rhodococcus globerulus]|uniref:hypothetical protein n=1 Tax=Rhodococcus globerulus TaxID=33008 RepID=UPI00301830B9